MKNLIKIILTILCCYTITTCSGQSKEYLSFISNFKSHEFPLEINYVNVLYRNRELYIKEFTRKEYLKFLNEMPQQISKNSTFHFGGKTLFKGNLILTYLIADVGDAPALDTLRYVMVVFNSTGKMLSKMTIGGQETEDKTINCVLNQDFTFMISIFIASNKLQSKKKYCVVESGLIKALP